MFYFIFYALWVFVTATLTYKWIRHLDKKERKFLKNWEKEYISAYKDIWEEQYYLKLAEEKKIKEYEEIKKKKSEETKEKLKTVHIEDFDSFEQKYVQKLKKAKETLVNEKENRE